MKDDDESGKIRNGGLKEERTNVEKAKKEEGEEREGVSGMARCSRSITDFARER